MRPYGSFSEFYQFIGRGIRVLSHPTLAGRVGADKQFLDIIYHAELGLDEHIDTIYRENDMDPQASHPMPEDGVEAAVEGDPLPIAGGRNVADHPEAFVLFQPGNVEHRIVHDEVRVEHAVRETSGSRLFRWNDSKTQSLELGDVSYQPVFLDVVPDLVQPIDH